MSDDKTPTKKVLWAEMNDDENDCIKQDNTNGPENRDNSGESKSPSLCNFGKNCTKPGCVRNHGEGSWQVTKGNNPDSNKPKNHCNFGLNCKRPGCQRKHFNRNPVKKSCKDGDNCTRKDCIFFHPKSKAIEQPVPKGNSILQAYVSEINVSIEQQLHAIGVLKALFGK